VGTVRGLHHAYGPIPSVGRTSMSERGHRVCSTQAIRLSQTIVAPLKYVYDGCTDYRSDDLVRSFES
jgi:hypothetical protein